MSAANARMPRKAIQTSPVALKTEKATIYQGTLQIDPEGTGEFSMQGDFRNLNSDQLRRVWNKLYDRLGDGGWYGWDWPTLRSVNPALYNSLVRVANEVSHRAQESLNA